MPTMQDVAKHAGVSVMTVSNVVNGHPHVRESTRDKVIASIAFLGYRVNTTARSLRQGRTGVIGLAVPEIDRPYFGMLATLLIERAAEHDYELVIEQTGTRRDDEVSAISHARLRSYDGLVLHSSQLADDDAAMFRADYPIVVLGERSYSAPVDHVVMANEHGGELAARHLAAKGCREVVMLGGGLWSPGDNSVSTLRSKGFLAGLEAAGLPAGGDQIRHAEYSLESAHAATLRLLRERPGVDGIFCATDFVALGAVRALADSGRRVPADVCVVGFDDVTQSAYTTPSLTTLAPDHEAMAHAAITMLVDRMSGRRADDDYREVVGSVHLVERESTAR